MKEVRVERTDWRDSKLGYIHKEYNFECPCDNVEFLMLEYDQSTPVALVDYRLQGRLKAGCSKAVTYICKNREKELPYLICEYKISDQKTIEYVNMIPCNSSAVEKFGQQRKMSEKEFVKLLYKCREHIVSGRTRQGIELAESLSPELRSVKENWEGEILSHRHRDWGWDCPVVDLDFVVSSDKKVLGIVEYKHNRSFASPKAFKNHPTGRALCDLGNSLSERIPVLFVYYDDDFQHFRIYPLNYGWEKFDNFFGVDLTRKQYFDFLTKL